MKTVVCDESIKSEMFNDAPFLRENVRFLLEAHNKLQSQVIQLQETVFSLQSRLYEIEAIADSRTDNETLEEDYNVK
jgi:uncharacterized protein YlxW (UPF0749 family)